MKFITYSLLLLAVTLSTRADSVRLLTGKRLSGRVLGYTNSQFVVEADNHVINKLSAETVKSIDFENDSIDSILEIDTTASLKGKVSVYDKGSFSVEDAHGQVDRIALKTVLAANFGNREITETTEKKDNPKQEAAPKKVDIAKVAQVTDAQLDKSLVPGKVTIVDFYADWCGPCRSIAPYLEELAKKDDMVFLRKVNVDKNQPLAAQFNVRSIPNIIIYNKAGKSIGTVRGADRSGVEKLVAKAKE